VKETSVSPSSRSPGAVSNGLHVLTLTPFYPNDKDDASGCFVYEPLLWLDKLGVENTVFAVQPFYRGTYASMSLRIPPQWIRYLSLPGGFGLPTAGAFVFAHCVGKLRELNRAHPVHLIHAHGALPCGHAAMLLSKELGIPFVVTVHGLDAYSTVQVQGRAGKWCRRVSQYTYMASQRVICVSERVREAVLQGIDRKCRTSVVYNGVDPDLFAPGNSAVSSHSMILSVGNLISVKGHELLIRSVATLVSKFPSLMLVIIGSGPEHKRLQRLSAQLGCADRVRFLGRKSRRETATAMRDCTVFALPSHYEGLGCVYLEAMSTGKPAVGCRGQGISEIIQQGSNGFLVGSENEKELTLVLSMLLGDEQRRINMGRAARDTIVEGFTLGHQAERLARIYRECAG
jgi:teichuronic acid biosynthesis glycosyltransferase TuaC